MRYYSKILKTNIGLLIFTVSFLRLLFLLVLLLLLSFAGGYFYYQNELEKSLTIPERGLIFEIHKGDSLNRILDSLVAKHVLTNRWFAKLYAREHKLAHKIQAGEFQLEKIDTIPSLFQLITNNGQIHYQIQFIEGHTFKQMQKVLFAQSKLELLIKDKSDQAIIKLLAFEPLINHLEGQFYPDTYTYVKGDTDISILKRAHKRLQKILNKEWSERQKNLPLKSAYEALILASIVEKETGAPKERAQIAGVFTRRLEKKMRLQTDPTVIYGLGDAYQGNLKRIHLKQFTPYNTYRIKGLPPTPIAMVGQSAIHAALHPAIGKSLYFVAKGDGSHFFSTTIQEHNKAVRKYQLRRRKDYRSTHSGQTPKEDLSLKESVFGQLIDTQQIEGVQ